MPHRTTPFIPSAYYHIYNRGANRQTIFFDRDNSLHFLNLIRRYIIATETADILAYCLMPNHYHLLLQLRQPQISEAMHRLAMAYTKGINKRYNRTGPLFQGPFRSIIVNQDSYLLQLVHYIHLNPVKAQFANHPKDWEFSSYHEYAGLRHGTLPSTTLLESQLAGQSYQSLLECTPIHTPDLIPLLLDA